MIITFKNSRSLKSSVMGATIASLLIVACGAKGDATSAEQSAKTQEIKVATSKNFGPPLEFRGTVSGDVLDMTPIDGEVVTDVVKHFKATGENLYRGNEEAVKKGYTIFSTACSGCHGHLAEGKLGPALADEYWTYPKNETDKGIFETIYGGAAGMMGPQQGRLTTDEILHVIAWVRHQAEENAKGGQATTH